MEHRLYGVRRTDTGEFYRGSKKRYGSDVRSVWVENPAKARLWWQKVSVESYFKDGMHRREIPPWEIVGFELQEMDADD